jgi:penicillin-binding protein 1A
MRTNTLQPDSIIEDSPLTLILPSTKEIYQPKNFDGQFLGPLTVRKALALSRNVCAVKVAQAVGINPIIETARSAGIESKLDPTLALALGASAVTPLELANAYATLARGGVYKPPVLIKQILDEQGKSLWSESLEAKRVFDPEPTAQLVDIMQDVVESGTGKGARLEGRVVAGKTGTADGARDVWFVGFTPDTVTSVWAGNDGAKSIAGNAVTGGSVTALIWKHYMQDFYATHRIPSVEFVPPQKPFYKDGQASLPDVASGNGSEISTANGAVMPLPAPDFSDRKFGGETAETKAPEKNGRKKSGGLGKLLHKVFGAFGG